MIHWLQHTTGGLLTLAAVSIALLLLLIIKVKVEPFIALIVVSLLTALAGRPARRHPGRHRAEDVGLLAGEGVRQHPRAHHRDHRARHPARVDPGEVRRRPRADVVAAAGVRREARAAGDGRLGPDLRHPGVLRHRHLRARAARLRRRQAGRPLAGALRPAAAGKPVDHARVPAAAPRAGRGRRAAARRPRLDHPDGGHLRHPGVVRRRHPVLDVDRQEDRHQDPRGVRGPGRRRRRAREPAVARPGRRHHRGAAGADPGGHVRQHLAAQGLDAGRGGRVHRNARRRADHRGAAGVVAARAPARDQRQAAR